MKLVSRYRDTHYKDNMFRWPSYVYNGIFYTNEFFILKWPSGACLNIKILSYQYRNSHLKDKTVSCYLYWDRAQVQNTTMDTFTYPAYHDDVIKWKHFPCNWPFVPGIHRSPVNSTHKGQWRPVLMFSLICAWINGCVNNREAGDLRCHHAHYDVIVMIKYHVAPVKQASYASAGMA